MIQLKVYTSANRGNQQFLDLYATEPIKLNLSVDNFNYSKSLTHIGHSEKVLVMRVFLTVLVLIFSLQSWTKADDISDFEIEGISIGDSVLDFFSKEEIKKDTPEEKK